jgi:hypothetical protein
MADPVTAHQHDGGCTWAGCGPHPDPPETGVRWCAAQPDGRIVHELTWDALVINPTLVAVPCPDHEPGTGDPARFGGGPVRPCPMHSECELYLPAAACPYRSGELTYDEADDAAYAEQRGQRGRGLGSRRVTPARP